MKSDKLRELVHEDIRSETTSLSELARSIQLSPTYISLWLRKKCTWDVTKLERRLRQHYSAKRLSVRDQLRMDRIVELLNDADDKHALIEALAAAVK